MSDEDLKAELERLRNENAALKKGASSSIRMKVSEKGAVSIYGMGRFPVTLYKEQWLKLLDMSDDIRAFIAANEAQLKKGISGRRDRGWQGQSPPTFRSRLPTKYETRLNLKTAKALGLSVPSSLLVRADEVIRVMSPIGTKRTSKCYRRMSAIGGKADMVP